MTKKQKRASRTATAYSRLAAKVWKAGNYREASRYDDKAEKYRRRANA